MTDAQDTDQAMLAQMVLSLQMGAMQQMGKFASPVTGKIERDMAMAKASIDMLAMLETKTKGNLTEDEEKLLGHALYELRLNYVDECKKGESPEKETGSEATEAVPETSEAEPDEATTDKSKS